jgi:hypothetical protein
VVLGCIKDYFAFPVNRQFMKTTPKIVNNINDKSLAMIAMAWKQSPRTLISLRDMIQYFASKLHGLLEDLEFYRTKSIEMIKKNGGDGGEASERAKGILNDLSEKIREYCQALELVASDSQGAAFERRLYGLVNFQSCTHQTIVTEIESFVHSIWFELGGRTFAFIPAEKAKYFEREKLFGAVVYKRFKSARYDIKEAGNCLAADLNTAAVFHLMRVAECGLRALATKLKIKLPHPIEFATWATVIGALDEESQKLKPTPKSFEREKELNCYSSLLSEARAFCYAWRDPVMHARKRFDEPHEAENVLNHVCRFMQELAKITCE